MKSKNTKDSFEKTGTITLPRGNVLFYRIKGDIKNKPVFLFIGGFPSTTKQIYLFPDDRIAYISFDRPGLGFSPYDDQFSFTQFANDIHYALTQEFKIEKINIFTTSGGGPFGLCFSTLYPSMVHKVGMFAAVAPFDQVKYTYSKMRDVPRFLEDTSYLKKELSFLRVFFSLPLPVIFLFVLCKKKSLLDQQVSSYYNVKWWRTEMKEGYRQGLKAVRKHIEVYYNDWGFLVKNVSAPVKIYHANVDYITQVEATKYYEKNIQDVSVTYVDGQTHGAIMLLYYKEMISWMLK